MTCCDICKEKVESKGNVQITETGPMNTYGLPSKWLYLCAMHMRGLNRLVDEYTKKDNP